MGTPVRLSPANITMPMLSFSRPLTNFDATALAASRRSGLKSRASIDDDMSIAIMMSVPSVRVVRQLSLICGRASTIIRQATAARRNTNSRWRTYCFHERGRRANGIVVDIAM